MVQTIQQQNEELLDAFEHWLDNKGVSREAIHDHLDNVSLFINVYLAEGRGGEVKRPHEADEFDVEDFLGDWFTHKEIGTSESTAKQVLDSLKYFYAFIAERGEMEAEDVETILDALDEAQAANEDWAEESEGWLYG